jgi:hypothetical protein
MHFSALRGRRTVPHILARLRLPLLVVVASLVSQELHAAVISRDWKTPGDGLLTYDDVNQREWLDLTESRLAIFPAGMRVQQLLTELGPGGKFEGFTWSKSGEFRDFAMSAGIDISTKEYVRNEAATRALITLVDSEPLTTQSGTVYVIGLLDETEPLGPVPNARIFADLRVSPTSGGAGDAGVRMHTDLEPFQIPAMSVWLYRPVPEPASWVLSILNLGLVRSLLNRKRRTYDRGWPRLPSAATGVAEGYRKLFAESGRLQPLAAAQHR